MNRLQRSFFQVFRQESVSFSTQFGRCRRIPPLLVLFLLIGLLPFHQTAIAQVEIIEYTYDQGSNGQGRLSIVTEKKGASLKGWSQFSYDIRGNVTRTDKAIEGASTPFTFQRSYDSLDRVVDMTYPDGEVVRNSYNNQGVLDKVRSVTHGFDYIANLDYNSQGRVTSKVLGNSKITTYTYHPQNFRLTGLSTPGLQNFTYAYDSVGNVSSIVDTLKSASQTFGYDDLHRLTSADSTAAPAYNHTYQYDVIGNLRTTGAAIGGGTLANLAENPGFESGSFGFPADHTNNWAAPMRLMMNDGNFAMDDTTLRTGGWSISVPNPRRIITARNVPVVPYSPARSYTGSVWIKTAALSGATAKVKLLFYDADQLLISEAKSAAGASGTADWTQFVVNVPPGGAPSATRYVDVAISVDVATNPTGTVWFDDASLSDGSVQTTPTLKAISYPAPGASRPHAPQDDSVWRYAYDANGNRITATAIDTGTTRSYTWDADNRLTRVDENGVTLAAFAYDYAGQRVKKVAGNDTTLYIGKHYECKNGVCSKFIFANGERVALRPVGSAEVYYYLPDHLGSTTVFTDRNGAPLQDLAYFPYGSIRVSTGSADVHHKYTGQEFDAEIGLYYYGARYYDPALAHFISPDTIEPNWANPQTLNRYSYTLNNPIKYIDPNGQNPLLFLIPIIGGILYDAFSTPDVAIAPTSPSDLSSQSPSTLEHLGSISAGASIGLAAREGMVALGKEVFEQATGIPTDVGDLAKGIKNIFEIHPRVLEQLKDSRLGNLAGKLTTDDLQRFVNNPLAQRVFDARSGNINVIQNIEGTLLRITVPQDAMRIISVGPIRSNQVQNLISKGDFVPLP